MHGWEKKRAALELWRKTGEWLTPFWTAFCFRLPCVDRVDHETRLYAAQNINEAAGDPETCYLRRVIVHFWYRYFFISIEFDERGRFFFFFFFFFSFFVDNLETRAVFLNLFFFFFFWINWLNWSRIFFIFIRLRLKYALKHSKLCAYIFLRFLKDKEAFTYYSHTRR